MNRFQPFPSGGGKFPTSDPYIRPEIELLDFSAEQGFAGSTADNFSDNPVIDGENPLDPYGPQN